MYSYAGRILLLILILVTSSSAGLYLRTDPEHLQEPGYPWLYLRDAQAIDPTENVVVLMAVGDLMLGRGMTSRSPVFTQVASQIRSADLALGNFEGAIPSTEGDPANLPGDPAYESYRLLIPESAVEELSAAGFDILSLANNHTLDGGEAGLANTRALLINAGIKPIGTPDNQIEASQITMQKLKGLNIAFLAFNFISVPHFLAENLYQETVDTAHAASESQVEHLAESISAQIRQARAQADGVIVSVHWGREYQLRPDPSQKKLAELMLVAGADVVLGHHPHVVQSLELSEPTGEYPAIHPQLIAYSLGNFAFDQGWEGTEQGLALRIYLDKQGLRAVQVQPVVTSPRPQWMTPEQASALFGRIMPAPPRQGFTCQEDICQPVAIPQTNTSGIFRSGQVDLSGDGVPEKIRRIGQSVSIYQGDRLVWQSPPEWHVLDLDLGDPNDDGRAEILLALNKRDPPNIETSHPFILGYRGGMYQLLWGGSAVRDPILEVELGDVNGDGIQELITLETISTSDQRTLTVWRWHGWGFSQLWRSPVGFYRDLSLIPGENTRISVAEPRSYTQTANK